MAVIYISKIEAISFNTAHLVECIHKSNGNFQLYNCNKNLISQRKVDYNFFNNHSDVYGTLIFKMH